MAYNILIVDDLRINRRLLRNVLKRHIPDAVFHEAEDGNQAMELMRDLDIDTVILDLVMPFKDGFSVLKEVRQHNGPGNVPVIVNSFMDKLEDIRQALDLGAYEYFTKPFSREQLQVFIPLKVKNALKSYELTKKLVSANQENQRELKLAQIFQQTLAVKVDKMEKVDISAGYIPGNQISGDFYDCKEMEGDTWFIIADVVGNGVAAAMLSVMLKVIFSNTVHPSKQPSQVLSEMNNLVVHLTGGDFYFTAFVGVIRENTLIYANGGHFYPVVFSGREAVMTVLDLNGQIVGSFEDAVFHQRELILPEDAVIFTFTDGLFGNHPIVYDGPEWEKIRKHITRKEVQRNTGFQKLGDYVIRAFKKYQPSSDDIAVMLLRRKHNRSG